MAKYTNNTEQAVIAIDPRGARTSVFSPGETKAVSFWVDTSVVPLTYVDETGSIDPIMLSTSYTIASGSQTVDVPAPKISNFYKLTVVLSSGAAKIAFNKSTHGTFDLIVGTPYVKFLEWSVVAKLILSVTSSSVINVYVEETYPNLS